MPTIIAGSPWASGLGKVHQIAIERFAAEQEVLVRQLCMDLKQQPTADQVPCATVLPPVICDDLRAAALALANEPLHEDLYQVEQVVLDDDSNVKTPEYIKKAVDYPIPGSTKDVTSVFQAWKHDDILMDTRTSNASNKPTRASERYTEAEERKKARARRPHGWNRHTWHDTGSIFMDQKTWVQLLVESPPFDISCASVLVLNAIFLGVQVEYMASTGNSDAGLWGDIGDMFFCIAFSVELFFRIKASDALMIFFFGRDWSWNWFDVVVVAISLIEIIVTFIFGESSGLNNLSVLRMLRVLRAVRVVRVARVMRFIRPLRTLISATFSTVKSCVWTVLLLAMIMYSFAIVFVMFVDEYTRENPPGDDPEAIARAERLDFFFGSIPRALLCLYFSMLGGIDWENAMTPLTHINWIAGAMFLVYISFVYLAVLNVVTGVFCQSAIEIANREHQDFVAIALSEKDKYEKKFKDLFSKVDRNGNGHVSLDDFEWLLTSSPDIYALLESLQIEIEDSWTLFKLLDVDTGGTVDLDEFVEGCLRLRGNAKSIQICELLYDNKWMMDKIVDIERHMMQEEIRRLRGH